MHGLEAREISRGYDEAMRVGAADTTRRRKALRTVSGPCVGGLRVARRASSRSLRFLFPCRGDRVSREGFCGGVVAGS